MRSLLAMADQWPGLSRLLDEALTLPADQRAAWLAQLAGADAGHREALEALLATQAGVETAGFLARLPALEPAEAADDLVAGAEVGAYRLVRPLGEGGMGFVWEAERTDGLIRRRVALKLPRAAWGAALPSGWRVSATSSRHWSTRTLPASTTPVSMPEGGPTWRWS